MATKIRLQRHGKKGKPFYYIVVADAVLQETVVLLSV
jgi:ribosomal protein S16